MPNSDTRVRAYMALRGCKARPLRGGLCYAQERANGAGQGLLKFCADAMLRLQRRASSGNPAVCSRSVCRACGPCAGVAPRVWHGGSTHRLPPFPCTTDREARKLGHHLYGGALRQVEATTSAALLMRCTMPGPGKVTALLGQIAAMIVILVTSTGPGSVRLIGVTTVSFVCGIIRAAVRFRQEGARRGWCVGLWPMLVILSVTPSVDVKPRRERSGRG